jgi:tight adherence protein C
MIVDLLYANLTDAQFMARTLAAVAAAATVITLAMPLLEKGDLSRRMKAVALERERIRARERERLAKAPAISLRRQPKAYMKQVVEQFQLGKWLGTDNAKQRLTMAGFRGPQAEVAFLFFRLVMTVGCLLFAIVYLFVLRAIDQPTMILIGGVTVAT